jgi:hypothetical protein
MDNSERSAVEDIRDDLMVQIPKDFLFEGMNLPATIYFQMHPGRYLVIGKRGDKANFSTLHSFQIPTSAFSSEPPSIRC